MPPSEERTLDVYARAFIPQFLQDINLARAREVFTATADGLDVNYADYLLSFMGSDLIAESSSKSQLRSAKPSGAIETSLEGNDITVSNYSKVYHRLLRKEIEALIASQREFTIYNTPLVYVGPDETGLSFVGAFLVPGVAEHSPHVKLGDIVTIRQVQTEISGQPTLYQTVLRNNQSSIEGYPLPGWNGREHETIVIGINRGAETVSIKVHGPIDPPGVGRETPRFNFSFPVRAEWQRTLWQTVRDVGDTMRVPTFVPTSHNDPIIAPKHANLSTYAAQPGMPIESVREETAILVRDGGVWMKTMLFPNICDGIDQQQLDRGFSKLKFKDQQLNFEQAQAIDSIQKNNFGAVPFLISGPPGTGKTKTLVEAALQLSQRRTGNSHILMCAPSDPAADTLVQRLKVYLQPSMLLRLNSPSRTFAEVPQELLPYCYVDGNHFGIPPFKDLMRVMILVVTSRDAEMLIKARVTNEDLYNLEVHLHATLHPDDECFQPKALHWSALLMDEAGQAIEPETLVPLTVVAAPSRSANFPPPQVVMAGDHKQLGPRIASRCKELELSFFERILERPLYKNHPLARHVIGRTTIARVLTKEMLPMKRPPFANLIRNYRSHPAILAIPNSLFYHDTLLTEASDSSSLASLSIWRGRRWPVLFCDNSGRDEIEVDGGGWYNQLECQKACMFAMEILKNKSMILQQDVCVMSPFQAQVRRLRKTFRAAGLHSVNIGPMEAFQGLESRFVILCTTRSRNRFLDQDRARGLGIIDEPKRMNVALTRAKQGLIVIGNAQLLDQDSCWKSFLDFCRRNGLWEGAGADGLENLSEVGERPALEKLLLGQDEAPGKQLGKLAVYDDEMWVKGVAASNC